MFNFRYSRWDGTQQVAPFDADELMEALSDDLMEYGDLRSALQRLYRWGDEGRLSEAEILLREAGRDRTDVIAGLYVGWVDATPRVSP